MFDRIDADRDVRAQFELLEIEDRLIDFLRGRDLDDIAIVQIVNRARTEVRRAFDALHAKTGVSEFRLRTGFDVVFEKHAPRRAFRSHRDDAISYIMARGDKSRRRE